MSDSLSSPYTDRILACSEAQIQELDDLSECLKIIKKKYIKFKIVYESVQECCSSDYLEDDLKLKVQKILLGHSCLQSQDLNSEGFDANAISVLGVINLTDTELKKNESIQLEKALELHLEDKYKQICQELQTIAVHSEKNASTFSSDPKNPSLSDEECELIQLKNKLEDQRRKYIYNLLKEQEVLEEIVNLRLNKLPELCNGKIKESFFKSQMSQVQSAIVQEKTKIEIFMETVNALPGFQQLINHIKGQEEECHRDIQHLKQLKKKYEQVDSKQYNELLKSYLQYKSSLEKKKRIYGILQIE